MTDNPTFVIIGAGLAGAKAAETLREKGFDGRVVLLGAEAERPYERPPLSKGLLLGSSEREKAYVHQPGWYAEKDVDLRTSTVAVQVDRDAHEVHLDDGSRVAYDKLLLATGSSPRRLDVPGGDLDGVLYLRTLADCDRIGAALRPDSRVVVIGAGWIGLEITAAGRQRGAAVTVVEAAGLPLQRVLGDEVARVFADLHAAHGVEFHFDAQVSALTGEGRVTGVALGDGTVLPADVVVVGVGIAPNVELARAAGLDVDNGVLVDAAMRTNDPDIFAAGDVANSQHPVLGRRVRVEHWSAALNGGPAAARAMLGEDVTYDKLPYFYTDQYDLGMEYTGYAEPGGYDRVVFRGDPTVAGAKSPEFVAFWVKDGRVLAGMNVNVWDVQDDIVALVKAGYSGQAVDLGGLADPNVPFKDVLPAT
jgi:3-phenylpropionate/trans-cinnamate dioxygenase ferredoxin reductase component